MGWDGIQNDGQRRDARGHLSRLLANDEKVLAAERVGDTVYAAYWGDDDKIIGLVLLIDRTVQRGWTYYKLMSEAEGPYESRCPASILDLLDPSTEGYTMEWRVRCRTNLLTDYRRTAALEST